MLQLYREDGSCLEIDMDLVIKIRQDLLDKVRRNEMKYPGLETLAALATIQVDVVSQMESDREKGVRVVCAVLEIMSLLKATFIEPGGNSAAN